MTEFGDNNVFPVATIDKAYERLSEADQDEVVQGMVGTEPLPSSLGLEKTWVS